MGWAASPGLPTHLCLPQDATSITPLGANVYAGQFLEPGLGAHSMAGAAGWQDVFGGIRVGLACKHETDAGWGCCLWKEGGAGGLPQGVHFGLCR